MSNAHAKLILDSLEKFPENLAKRRQIVSLYNELIPKEWHMPERYVPWVYDVRLPDRHTRIGETVSSLNSMGVQARLGFKPMSQQPEYLGEYKHLNAYKLSQEILYLPISPDLTEQKIRFAADALIRLHAIEGPYEKQSAAT